MMSVRQHDGLGGLRRSALRVWMCTAGLLSCLGGGTAFAHGGPPQVVGVVAANAEGAPSLVLLNEGLAQRDEVGWSFLCPSLWGRTDLNASGTPLAAALEGERSLVVGADDLYLAADGIFLAQGHSELSSASITALAAGPGTLFGMRVTATGTEIVALDPLPVQVHFASNEFWSAFAVDSLGRMYLAKESPGVRLGVRVLAQDGEVEEEFELPLEMPLASAQLYPLGDQLFATLYDGKVYHFVELAAAGLRRLGQSSIPVAGPIQTADGSIWLALNSSLAKLQGEDVVPVDESRPVTCLESLSGHAYGCSSSELYRFDEGGLGSLVFELDGLYSPVLSSVSAEAEQSCTHQWQLFTTDLAKLGLSTQVRPPAPGTMAAADDGMGISMTTEAAVGAAGMLAVDPMDTAADKPAVAMSSSIATAGPRDAGADSSAEASSSGCALHAGKPPSPPVPWLLVAAALLVTCLRSRR